jgi:hypothetical protein
MGRVENDLGVLEGRGHARRSIAACPVADGDTDDDLA